MKSAGVINDDSGDNEEDEGEEDLLRQLKTRLT